MKRFASYRIYAVSLALMIIGVLVQSLLLSGHIPFLHLSLRSQAATAVIERKILKDRDQGSTLQERFHRPTFQSGIVFPQWGTTAYSNSDANWQIGLSDIQKQTAAQWIELPINFFQSPSDPTQILTTDSNTPTPEAVAAGIRSAHAEHYHVFVVPLLTVTPGRYQVQWSGSIQFGSIQETKSWFMNYWQAYQPYVIQAAKAGADQLSIGTEFEQLQTAPGTLPLWNQLITQIHQIYHGKLTYDINWSSLYYYQPPKQYPLWLSNPNLSAIGVSVYIPLAQTPERLDPQKVDIAALWRENIRTVLDTFSVEIGKPVLVSEIGYRNSMYAFYNPWERDSIAQRQPQDPGEQAAGYDAAMRNVLADKHIIGIFFWAWSIDLFAPNYKPAAQVLYKWYTSPQA